MKDKNAVLEIVGISKSFMTGPEKLVVLDKADLTIRQGETVALMAPSGTGKSTLLQIAALLDTADSGDIRINGQKLPTTDVARSALRCNEIGFVYQFHHLLNDFTALENVMLPALCAGMSKAKARERAAFLLKGVGLAEKLDSYPGEMSGGERQRAAIARASVNAPSVLLADEPTGNLDLKTGDDVFRSLLDLIKKHQTGALIATHNMDLAKKMDRIITLKNGKITQHS